MASREPGRKRESETIYHDNLVGLTVSTYSIFTELNGLLSALRVRLIGELKCRGCVGISFTLLARLNAKYGS